MVVLGVEPPTAFGMETARQLLAQIPDVAVVVLSATSDDALLLKALDSGCSAFVTKGRSITDLVVAIKAAARGDSMFPFKALGRYRGRSQELSIETELTCRELEILELLGKGETTTSITDRLTLSPHTVRNHVRNLLAKLGVHSKLEAVLRAQSLGLIEPAAEDQRASVTSSLSSR